MPTTPSILIGIDVGRATLSMALGKRTANGSITVTDSRNIKHDGRPFEVFCSEYAKLNPATISGISVTGAFGSLLLPPALSSIPVAIAQQEAALHLFPGQELNILRLGAGGYSILTLDKTGRSTFSENDKCSSGTGQMIEKICGRLGLGLDEAIDLAHRASGNIPISSRCSVFAQTEITHYANQGERKDMLLAGYFKNVAASLFALFDQRRNPGPVVMIGNGARIAPIRAEFARLAQVPVAVPEEAPVFEALGALYFLANHLPEQPAEWPSDPRELFRSRRKRFQSMPPAAEGPGSVLRLPAPDPPAAPDDRLVLGLDLGSTGAKAVLLGAVSAAPVLDLYRTTDGDPVQAARLLVSEILAREARPVIAVGITGSGREAASAILRAACPQAPRQGFVFNEIVAHATAAAHLDPDQGRSLTVVEIGGQDAKFINLMGGKIRESNLNCACSAGTGAFLEEQANLYGVRDHEVFARMAAAADHPPDLGQMCSIFVAELAAEAGRDGFSTAEIFAGLLHSVIINYKNRVMGHRQFLDRVFFQGKPAENPALARTLAAVAGREIVVPPNPGAMGAIGAALLAREKLREENFEPMAFGSFLSSRTLSQAARHCPNRKCGNACRLEEAEVGVDATTIKLVTGGACPEYDGSGAAAFGLPPGAPRPFRQRRELLRRVLDESPENLDGPELIIPQTLGLVEHLPFFHRFFSRLGIRVKVVAANGDTIQVGNRLIGTQGTCTPAKVIHGLIPESGNVFLPQIISYRTLFSWVKNISCPLIQSTPAMVAEAVRLRRPGVKIISPLLQLGYTGFDFGLLRELTRAVDAICRPVRKKVGKAQIRIAIYEGLQAQKQYEKELFEIGRRAIDWARENHRPVVLVAGNYYVIHEPAMNAGVPDIIAREGAVALPIDCYQTPYSVPALSRLHHGIGRRVLRASLGAAYQGGIFPLILASYGCGPITYIEHIFNDLFKNYPHTLLESDGHGGRAGYVTRIQAFLHSVQTAPDDLDLDALLDKAGKYDRRPSPTREEMKNSRLVVLGAGPGGGSYAAAIKRSRGFDADQARPEGPETLRVGRMSCSGKECLPHSMIWGAFSQYLQQKALPPDRKIICLNVTGDGPCNNGMFNLVNEINLENMGLADRVRFTGLGAFKHDLAASVGGWTNIVGIDLLNLLRGYLRPDEPEPGAVDRLFTHHVTLLEKTLLPPVAETGPLGAYRNIRRGVYVIAEAARDFAALVPDQPRRPTVYVCGDVYLRLVEQGNDDLVRKLNALGLRVLLQPAGETLETIAALRSRDLIEMETAWLKNRIMLAGLQRTGTMMANAAAKYHPWLRWENIGSLLREARVKLDKTMFMESIVTIGSGLRAWKNNDIDGVVVISPWGCSPAHIAEALLSQDGRPWLFLYHDGDHLDEGKLQAFAWRMKQ